MAARQVNLLKWRNPIVNGVFGLFVTICVLDLVVEHFKGGYYKNPIHFIASLASGLMLTFLYTWYTVLNYLLRFISKFKRNEDIRFIFLEIPLIFSLLFLSCIRFVKYGVAGDSLAPP